MCVVCCVFVVFVCLGVGACVSVRLVCLCVVGVCVLCVCGVCMCVWCCVCGV